MGDLFGYTKPKQKRRVIMHAVDVGEAPYKMPEWNTASGGHFVCDRCEHDDGWKFNLSITEIRRGLPCPICNEGAL